MRLLPRRSGVLIRRRTWSVVVLATAATLAMSGVAAAAPNPDPTDAWDIALAMNWQGLSGPSTATFLQSDGVTMNNCGGPYADPSRTACNFLHRFTVDGIETAPVTTATSQNSGVDHLNLFDEDGPDGPSFSQGSFGQIFQAPASGMLSSFSLDLACKIPGGQSAPTIHAGLYQLDATQSTIVSQVASVPFDFADCPTTTSFDPSPTTFGWVPLAFDVPVVSGTNYAVLLYGAAIGGAQPDPTPTAPTAVAGFGGQLLVGLPFSATLSADGDPAPTFAVTSGALPAGLTLNTTSGVVSGTPTTAGRYLFTVTASNPVGSAAHTYHGTVAARTSAPSAPRDLAVTPGNHRLGLSFRAPASDGGSPLTGYQVSPDAGHTWRSLPVRRDAQGGLHSALSGLANGVVTRVRVRALNAHFPGAWTGVATGVANSAPLGAKRTPAASQIRPPKNLRHYHGAWHRTTYYGTSWNGTWAHRVRDIGDRQLTAGEAVGLGGIFRYDSARLTAAGLRKIRILAGHLRLAHALVCEGYADYAGTDRHELALSRQRAAAVCSALRADGVHLRSVRRGYGGAHPVVVGGKAKERSANRRVVVLVAR